MGIRNACRPEMTKARPETASLIDDKDRLITFLLRKSVKT